jgi:alkylated DNA repair dioxygenase AlkB
VTKDDPSEVPGLRYRSDWLGLAEQVDLLAAIDVAPWSTELKRRVQHYGRRYDYGNRTTASGAPPLPAWAVHLAGRLHSEGWMSATADQVIVNEYLPGQGISAHVDCVPCFGPEVAAVSLGSACVMDYTDPTRRRRVPVPLAAGSLSVMTGPARYEWRHGIAARKSDATPAGRVARARRVSVTFRLVTA